MSQDGNSDGTPRRRWWRTTLIVIGSVLVLAAVAVVGVVVGRETAPGPDIVVTALPVLEESPAAEPLPVATLPSLTVSTSVQPSWPALLTAVDGLDDTTTTASGYRLVNAGISPGQVAGVLGPVFGIEGIPVAEGASWTTGALDGPHLVVADDSLVTWTFEDPSASARPAVGAPLSAERAIELAAALLGSIGVDTASVDWQVDRFADLTSVTAWQLVAGARTRLSWEVGFGPSGAIVRAAGFSAGLEEVPDYPVVGARSAVERSGQPGWSAIGPTLISAGGPVASPASPSASARPDRPVISVAVTEVSVTEADLALAQYGQPDGSVLFLPAYVLTGADGSRWSLLAVDEPYVEFVDQPYPTAIPAAS